MPVKTWIGSELNPMDGLFTLNEACLSEIENALCLIRDNPLPLLMLHPSNFYMPRCKELINSVLDCLENGLGFCLLDRLPIEDMTDNEAKSIFWLLSQMLGRPVAQKWCDGRMLYSVTDLGRPSGNGVRPDVTNEEQSFHTDNSYNICPPNIVGLLCLQPSMRGGLSRVVNMKTVLERMEITNKTHTERLYRPFVFDRQKEHSERDPATLENPILKRSEDGLRIRVSRNLIYQGYALRGESIDNEGEEALAAFFDLINDPEMYKEFQFAAGQIQFLNNRVIGHKRTSFKDWPNSHKKRHLCRVWLRDHDRVFYNG